MTSLADHRVTHGSADAPITDIVAWLKERMGPAGCLRADSREVQAGDAFFAWPGRGGDGRAFIDSARARGAAAIIADGAAPAPDRAPDLRVVTDLRSRAGEIAAEFHGRAVARIKLVAVTGTNGKTTCSHWIAQGLSRIGQRSGLIGTLGSGLLDTEGRAPMSSFGLTMPDSLTLHALLAQFVAQGAGLVVMEASSIGLDQHRLSGARASVAVFTNLSRDHLDYHGSLEAYGEAKLRLFQMPGLEAAVLNAHDALSERACAVLPAGCRVIAYGEAGAQLRGARAEYLIADRIDEGADGLTLELAGDFGCARVTLPVVGRFNAANALAATATWISLGMTFDQAIEQLACLRAVPGRLERVSATDGQSARAGRREGSVASTGAVEISELPAVVVDYAHTPDALEKALSALRPLTAARGGRLWCVFGAGGDRDAGKRPLMGAVASAGADRVIVTSDNPRSEDPLAIARDIAAGLVRPPVAVEIDRQRAIEHALREAGPQDVVLIAGKGHERWQELSHGRVPFDDVAQARKVLQSMAGALHA